jgi:hypothetical protein
MTQAAESSVQSGAVEVGRGGVDNRRRKSHNTLMGMFAHLVNDLFQCCVYNASGIFIFN